MSDSNSLEIIKLMKSTKLSMENIIEQQSASIEILESQVKNLLKSISSLNKTIEKDRNYIQRLEALCDHHEIDTDNDICVGCYEEYKHDDNKVVCSLCEQTDLCPACITVVDGDAVCVDCNDDKD